VSEALRLDREDLSLDGAFVRVIGKGDKERLVPIGDVALDGW
jgi:integrase/recombinase XerD